jgi:polyhydroxybutyrate depolymerase
MRVTVRLVLLGCCLFIAGLTSLPAAELVRRTWSVEGVTREALLYLPAGAEKGGAPVVFVFHGHGGKMRRAASEMPLHKAWPEAIVVYPQGVPTPLGDFDPKGKYSGWQSAPGEQRDRDLKFFDAIHDDLTHAYRPDPKRWYALGHSNGGYFSYLLWATRGNRFAAVACSAASLPGGTAALAPKPIFHVGSPEDKIVKFPWQQDAIVAILKLNACPPFKPAAAGFTLYPSTYGNDVAVYLHDRGHNYPKPATELIAKFFRDHPGH